MRQKSTGLISGDNRKQKTEAQKHVNANNGESTNMGLEHNPYGDFKKKGGGL